jgi:hypothetical protein
LPEFACATSSSHVRAQTFAHSPPLRRWRVCMRLQLSFGAFFFRAASRE